jgi:flavin reductase (DIM6/NTAB) family NADH-FMN oxidoreductase RutF
MDTNTNCTSSEEGGDTNSSDDPWVTLNGSKKEFSRLLYPNPVCFLCTPSCGYPGEEEDYHENVMTISWLTAINNEGCFVMSLNRRRATARYFKNHHHNLDTGHEFCLCVPIAGMESLVLAVGRTSQRFASKFPKVEKDSPSKTKNNKNNTAPNAGGVVPHMSKRQRKRLEQIQCAENGIPGLIRVPFGNGGVVTNTRLFCIEGTVAHMHCRTYRIVDENVDTQQDTHCIIYAQVMNAVCRSSHWNSHKKVFCSAHGENPILTFLGSQTFGHVVAAANDRDEEKQGRDTETLPGL